ncbi:outer membrane protein assembly factor BamE domain-containing protein [Neisseria perflava]|uniref:outer membrane protein assembly factor BamE domain-containing protein n=1 Tax=Neisseria perflava TaxID=33053 RepID=UPI0020A14EB7|nr:outer membrane protein assembly factor BamE [Neisseria perflava]MCP1660949.1 outer membrane protein assembly factor BamE (lipoprotein component of BamABCDE complex) [Neisseria perflava]MCP1773221.1 outer membrane protein assembly factor BamE (lipoprotein component of BamABCDE complex) [Neisseria perflava]
MKRLAVILMSAILLGACASSGNTKLKELTVEQAKQQVTEGVTTKNEVETKFGSPDSVSFTDGGNEIWTYRYSEATSHATNFIPIVGIFKSGQDVKTKEMVVMFDKNNVVQRFTMRNSNSVQKAGILGK